MSSIGQVHEGHISDKDDSEQHLELKHQVEPIGQEELKGQAEHKGRLESKGQAEHKGRLEFKGQAEHKGHLESKGQAELKGQLEFKGQAELKGQREFKGQAELKGQRESKGQVECKETQEEQRSAIQVYLEFLAFIWNNGNYRYGLIMQTGVTLALIVSWSILWPPAKDTFYNMVMKTSETSSTSSTEDTECREQYRVNSACDLTEFLTQYQELKINYSSLQGYVKHLQEDATAFNQTLIKHAEQIQNTSLSVKKIGSNVTDFKHQLYHQSEQTHRVQKDMDRTVLKQISDEAWQYLCILLAVGEICLVLYVLRLKTLLRDGRREPQVLLTSESRQYANSNVSTQQPHSVMDRISKTSTENSVCILSFNGDPAHKKHMTVSRTFLDKTVKVTECVIDREEDILNVPPSKVVLVHVDYNSRNIILENPEREVGELKRKTVLALWRMNADVILLYHYEDKDAKPLGEQDLYSSDLVSVTTQTELKHIEKQQRFISLNGQLSMRQKQHLDGLVKIKIG
ncbi:uncharacterized protein LOC132559248 [Ylistrum balloti]|uniref:uncharacterized protein LOC132559248 n=1 Tax=Ylistrum balloti TaxID=509963 RepID=UPI0029059245|nr:uncharacterized protein LOC132559248 [Ylistrum balloti]